MGKITKFWNRHNGLKSTVDYESFLSTSLETSGWLWIVPLNIVRNPSLIDLSIINARNLWLIMRSVSRSLETCSWLCWYFFTVESLRLIMSRSFLHCQRPHCWKPIWLFTHLRAHSSQSLKTYSWLYRAGSIYRYSIYIDIVRQYDNRYSDPGMYRFHVINVFYSKILWNNFKTNKSVQKIHSNCLNSICSMTAWHIMRCVVP
jgi:hypothetical protein